MGKIHDRFKAKAMNRAPVTHGPEIREVKSAGHSEPALDSTLRNFKYVVSYDRAKKIFTVDITSGEGFHSDCYVPDESRAVSAGWVSCPSDEFVKGDFTNMRTWGHSIGLQIETHPRDLNMLKQYFAGADMVFNSEGVPA